MKEKHNNKVPWLRIALIGAAILLLGAAAEFLCNYRELSLQKENRQIWQVPLDQITYEGFYVDNGCLVFDQDYGVIRIDLGGRYVKKLGYGIDYEGPLKLDAHIAVRNENGQTLEKEEIHIKDYNSKLLPESWLNIRQRVDHANLIVQKADLEEYVGDIPYVLKFTGFYVNNMPVFNYYRLLFFWCALAVGAFLWISRTETLFGRAGALGKRIEIGFLAVSLTVGTLMIVLMPSGKVGWDEEIHFERSFWLASYPKTAHISKELMDMFSTNIETVPTNQPDGIEEQEQLDRFLNRTCDYRTGDYEWRIPTHKQSFQGYLGSMAGLRAGSMLGLPFTWWFALGRWGNLLLYCVLMYFAIRITPMGKAVMALIGLMPTPIFLACTFSYDPMVTAGLYLSFAFMLREITSDIGKINWKHYAVMLALFYISCRSKAVYAPLILMGLLIPRCRYYNKRQLILMRAGFILVCGALMLSFLLPAVTAPPATGDLRGGDTSVAGQMSYILGQPVTYAKVLMNSMVNTIPEYLFGKESFGLLAHLGESPCTWFMPAAIALAVLTNNQSLNTKQLTGYQRLWILLLAGASAVLVWTSMYMAFTPPGAVYISGVQGRYYIPFLYLLYLLCINRKVILHIELKNYYTIVLGLAAMILMATVYETVLVQYCL